MSFFNSWIAVQGIGKWAVRETFELEETGEQASAMDVARPFSYAELPGGWLVIFGPYDWATIDRVKELSRSGPAMGMVLNDKVDAESVVFAARDGEFLWEVSAVDDALKVRGTPPPEYEPLRQHYASAEAVEELEDWAIHELAIELARKLCGFRADEEQALFMGLKPIKGGASESLGKSGCFGLLLAPLVLAALYYGPSISNG